MKDTQDSASPQPAPAVERSTRSFPTQAEKDAYTFGYADGRMDMANEDDERATPPAEPQPAAAKCPKCGGTDFLPAFVPNNGEREKWCKTCQCNVLVDRRVGERRKRAPVCIAPGSKDDERKGGDRRSQQGSAAGVLPSQDGLPDTAQEARAPAAEQPKALKEG